MAPPIINRSQPAMTDSVSFKAYLKRDGQEVEVRRFGVDSGAATSYVYLRSKVQAMFPAIQNDQFQIFWQDVDQDYIRMDSDEELFEALTSSSQRPLKIYIHVQNGQGAGAGSAGRQTHPGVTCDGCEGPVVGFRYKCVTCPDYDLCGRCEANGLHEHHFMLRMPTPMEGVLRHPKFIRKLFSHPHKFHKRHGWGRQRGCGDSQAGPHPPPPARCPAMAGVTDMFDFSALMELLESVGVFGEAAAAANQSAGPGPTAAPAEGTSGAQAQGPSGGQETRDGPSGERRESSRGAEYLTNIGQMVAAILDPLGVDVTFDVRTKTTQGQTADSADPSPAPTPAPAQASNAPAQTPNAHTQASNAPTQTSNAPTQTSNAPTQTSNAPTQAPNVPVQTSNVPTQTVYNTLPLTYNAPAQASNTPVQTSNAPVQTSNAPAQPSFYGWTSDGAITIATPSAAPLPERRNSDDWTLINRESPTRAEASAMDIDENQGARPKTSDDQADPAPHHPSNGQAGPAPHHPTAPPQDDLSEADRKRIQDALETFRAMGFNFDPERLRDLLKKQNCDIFSVLEIMLNTERK